MYVSIGANISVYTYIYAYISTERERERDRDRYIYIYICIYVHTRTSIHMYTYTHTNMSFFRLFQSFYIRPTLGLYSLNLHFRGPFTKTLVGPYAQKALSPALRRMST